MKLSPKVRTQLRSGVLRAKPSRITNPGPRRPGIMHTYRCSGGCGTTVTCLGQPVGHNCPTQKSRFIRKWELVK